ncbi:MAG: lipoprotein [Motiliproteus sp.]
MLRVLIPLLLGLILLGCGQKGGLYLPPASSELTQQTDQ